MHTTKKESADQNPAIRAVGEHAMYGTNKRRHCLHYLVRVVKLVIHETCDDTRLAHGLNQPLASHINLSEREAQLQKKV